MVFVADTVIRISPVCTATILIETVTWSVRYCSLTPMPKYLAPTPPEVMLVSYPTIPPSTKSPANFRGFKTFFASPSPSYSSLVDLINCLSLIIT